MSATAAVDARTLLGLLGRERRRLRRAREAAPRQNVGAGYSNEHEGIALLEGAVVCHALIAPASRGCDRGWRAATMLRSRSTQEMDVGRTRWTR